MGFATKREQIHSSGCNFGEYLLLGAMISADPSVGVWEQLQPGSGLAPTVKGPIPSSTRPQAKKKQ